MSIQAQQVQHAFSTLEEIAAESSTNAKGEILATAKDNDVMRILLYAAYNPFKQYFIIKMPKYNSVSESRYKENFEDFVVLLNRLSERQITGNAAKADVVSLFERMDGVESQWYSRVIGKDLKIGMAAKSINKVFPSLIPTYEVMLANSIANDLEMEAPKTLKMLPKRVIIQPKLDGYRLNLYHYDDGSVVMRSRNGKLITGYNQLEKEAAALPKGYVYDGEMMSPEFMKWVDQNKAADEEAEATREFFSEAASHAFSHETDKQGVFNIFDAVPISEWEKRNKTAPYETRADFVLSTIMPSNSIDVVPSSRVFNCTFPEEREEIKKLFRAFLKWGYEGAMIKDADSPYVYDRSNALLKMKLMETLDLPVIAVHEGSPGSKYVGMMGRVDVEYKGNPVGVGSGWKDEQRQAYWEDPNAIIGKTIEVAYQAESHDKTGKPSLSFPVFKRVRDDK